MTNLLVVVRVDDALRDTASGGTCQCDTASSGDRDDVSDVAPTTMTSSSKAGSMPSAR